MTENFGELSLETAHNSDSLASLRLAMTFVASLRGL